MQFFSFLSNSILTLWDQISNKLSTPKLGAILGEQKLDQRIVYSLGQTVALFIFILPKKKMKTFIL